MKLGLMLALLILAFVSSCHKCKTCKKGEEATTNASDAGVPPPDSSAPAPAPVVSEGGNGSEGPKPQESGCVAWPKDQVPTLLSKTGCFEAQDPNKPIAGLVPYEVNVPFWSDAADKKRWFALPTGGSIRWSGQGQAIFPRGSVLVKEFTRGGKKLETRFFVLHQDDRWVGYSYEWNAAGNEATYIGTRGKVVDTGDGQQWSFPASRDCMRCHSEVMNYTLGWEFAQINVPTKGPNGQPSTQLLDWQNLALVDKNIPPTLPETLRLRSLEDAEASAADKARSYLHANCSFCHRPGSMEPSNFDLRAFISFADMKICNVVADLDDLGVADSRMFKPQLPEQSIVYLRLVRSDYSRMPPLASLKLDEAGSVLVREWIRTTADCNQP